LFNDQSFKSVLEKNEVILKPGETMKLKTEKFSEEIFNNKENSNEDESVFLIILNVFQEGFPNYILGIDEDVFNTLYYISEPIIIKNIH
jgi:hypothetical protein